MNRLHKILHLLAQGLSYVLYPLFIPTYGMVLFCATMVPLSGDRLPLSAWLVSVGTTFILTALIPITAIMIRVRRGKVTDLYISDPAQRTVPYIYTAVGFGFWCYLLAKVLQAPLFIDLVAIGATLALIGVMLINRRWKISAHLTAMGGLVGGVMSHSLATQQTMLWLPLALMLLSLLLMYARIYLRAHDPLQVIAGFLFGLCMTFLPNMIISYVA
ncbi:MAG: hypothetical protein IKP93_06485 [Paludibacteraceae bacterium]|nr:hypothetical protein [Paludibacteraceae bacterium]